MSPYQERIMGLIQSGMRLVQVERWEQFGRRPLVWVLMDGEREVESIRQPTVDRLVELGVVEVDDDVCE